MYNFQVRMPKRVRVPISTARAEIFRLAELVRQSRDETIVVLEGRGGVDSVALVREARLAYLEDREAQMNLQAPSSFRLAGSLATTVDDQALTTALRELRQAWTGPSLAAPAPDRTRTPVRKRPRPA